MKFMKVLVAVLATLALSGVALAAPAGAAKPVKEYTVTHVWTGPACAATSTLTYTYTWTYVPGNAKAARIDITVNAASIAYETTTDLTAGTLSVSVTGAQVAGRSLINADGALLSAKGDYLSKTIAKDAPAVNCAIP